MNEKPTNIFDSDSALEIVPENERQHWIVPTTIFGGLEFSVPVIMIGATLASSFSINKIILILAVSLIIFQWVGNFLQGYIGAKTGLSSSVIARSSFGRGQARFIVGFSLVILNIGWFAVNTAVAGNAISAVLGVDYTSDKFIWAILTIIAGLLFALPAVIGYSSMKWTDYIAVPAGLILIISAVFYVMNGIGFEAIKTWNPMPSISFWGAISIVLGVNVAQWLIASDYTRYSKPKVKDQALIPLGIIVVGFVFFLTGALMSIGVGNADIVVVMQELGFPFWGFLILWLALWTSQLVASYSTGLAAANIFNVKSGKGRAILTILGAILGIILALLGVLDYFMDFLILLGILYPAIAGIIFIDFFIIKKQCWEDRESWNINATIALISGSFVGYLTQYIYSFGIPTLHSLVVSGLIYLVLEKIKEYNWRREVRT